MTLFKAFEEGMQVNGTTIMSIVDGMGAFRTFAEQVLEESGLNNIISDANHWYPQQAWLDAFEIIAKKIGPNTLLRIGEKIPENAIFPIDIDSIEKALKSIDIAYHMNHRNANGEILFDPSRDPHMLEGIGHYTFKSVSKNIGIVICENPYPDDFDRGIVTSMARRFVPEATIHHDDTLPCRKNGDRSCTYTVSW